MKTGQIIFGVILVGILMGCARAPVGGGGVGTAEKPLPLPSFTLTEHFGVSHPDQIITFDLPPGTPTSGVQVVDGATNAVPFQFLEGGQKLAVRTALAAGETKRFGLRPGTPAAAGPDAVTIGVTPETIEIASASVAVRLPNFATPGMAVGTSWANAPTRPLLDLDNYGSDAVRQVVRAPVQGVRLRDGTWSGLGPNMLVALAKSTVDARVQFLERGPLKTVAQVVYRFDKPSYDYGPIHLSDAGPGDYTCTITVQAGQPSILFEEESDLEMVWGLNLYAGLAPDQARYRGHHSSQPKFGYEPDGRVYRAAHQRGGLDAQVDLTYDRPRLPRYHTSDDSWMLMACWNPWIENGGWYWQMFNRDAPDTANIAGIFAGRASRALGAHMSGAGLFTLPADPRDPQTHVCGVAVQSYRRGPDNSHTPRSRFQWGLFLASKRELPSPDKPQPINIQMNLHGGINLDKIQRYTLDFPDPPQGYGAMYMPRAAVTNLIARLHADKSGVYGGGFHSWLYNAETMGRELVDLWADTSGKQAAKLTAEITGSARTMLDMFVNKGGIYDVPVHYWHGGLEMSRKLVWLDQLMGSDQTTPEQKLRLKATAVLFASILYDNDFVPLDNCGGFNLGTPNMPIQQQNYRQMYALMLANHPMMKERAKGVAGAAKAMLAQTVNEHGAHMGSLHYVGAANGPLLATFQQLQMAGVYDAFATNERLAKFAEFYLQALTPPEVRFGKHRKMAAIGDGGTEGTEEYGMMGTGFAQAKPELSRRLMGAWRENGKVHTGFHGSTLLKINDELPGVSPNLGDAKFPGYFSVLRSGWGTPEENAVWCVNGNFYVDHGHNDLGELVIYLLGAPLSIDWGPIYTPRVSGGVMHSTVIQERAFGQPWDQDVTSLDNGVGFSGHYGNHGVGEATSLDTYPDGTRMVSTVRSGSGSNQTTWVRTVSLVTADPKLPVLLIRDTFSGKDAAEPKIWTMNLMAEGAVETPSGNQTPPLRTFPAGEKATDPATQMPSAGPVFPLASGVNRLGFTGQKWKGHPSGGIDWDVYVLPSQPQQAQIGNWANSSAPCGGEFQNAQGRKFEERQDILRVRGTGEFVTVIAPWNKGAKPEDLNVTREDGKIVVQAAGRVIRFKDNGEW